MDSLSVFGEVPLMSDLSAVTEMYERNVILATEWARAHEDAMRRVWAAFERDGKWPSVETLQRDLSRGGDARDLIGELGSMPPSLGVVQFDGEVSLSIRGLALLPQAAPLLNAYMKVIRLAVERYRGEQEKPQVTDADLREELGMDDELAARVGILVFNEGWPFGSGGGEGDGSWHRDVPVELRHLLGAESIEDFLATQAKLRYGPPTPALVPPQAPEPAPPRHSPVLASAPNETTTIVRHSALKAKIFRQLIFKVLAKLKEEHYFVEGFEEGEHMAVAPRGETIAMPPRIEDPEAWLMLNLNTEGLWPSLKDPSFLAGASATNSPFEDRDLLLRTLEILYRDVVSKPVFDSEGGFEGFYDRGSGQAGLREAIAPILERLQPSLEMRSDGEIVAKGADGLGELGDQPLPTSEVADDVRDKVLDAIRAFRDVGATKEAQLSALSQLAGVLERLRADERLDVLDRKDQGRLFEIANEFGIRHDKPGQKRDFGPAFREWIFYAYLATIHLTMRALDDDNQD